MNKIQRRFEAVTNSMTSANRGEQEEDVEVDSEIRQRDGSVRDRAQTPQRPTRGHPRPVHMRPTPFAGEGVAAETFRDAAPLRGIRIPACRYALGSSSNYKTPQPYAPLFLVHMVKVDPVIGGHAFVQSLVGRDPGLIVMDPRFIHELEGS